MPLLYTSFTRATGPWFSWQNGVCADYEYEWTLCASRVNFKDAATVCKKLHDDFIECAYKVKSVSFLVIFNCCCSYFLLNL